MDAQDVWGIIRTRLEKGECIRVRVKPGARHERVTLEHDTLIIALRARAVEGKANAALLHLVRKHTGVRVRITHGLTSREKRLCPDA